MQTVHKNAVIRFLKEAEATLGIVGSPPQYDFLNPTECVCYEDDLDVAFLFSVGIVGGGRCKSEIDGPVCQGKTKSAAGGQVEGEIVGPPHGDVIFERP